MPNLKISGQSLSEFALILAVVIGAISGMQIYVQRGLQVRYKDGVNYAISQIQQEAAAKGFESLSNISLQYEPSYQESSTRTNINSDNTIGFPDSRFNETTVRSGWQRQTTPLPNLD